MYRRLIYTFVLISVAIVAAAQSIIGTWSGDLKVSPQASLKIVFHIESENSIKIDSPDQGAFGLKGEIKYISPDSINMMMPQLNMSFAGHRNDNMIEGTFMQGGLKLPLVLSPDSCNRPQTPRPPFPYTTEEVSISYDDISLAGTLTIPENANSSTPVVVMVTGSGLQNRDEELFDHKPFAVIADFLARNGIASLRYDDRGGNGSTGSREHATTKDYASDAQAVIDFLRSTNRFGKIGLLGHSEGGVIAYMLAAKDRNLDFIVSLAGPVVKGTKTSGFQNKVLAITQGIPETVAEQFGKAVENAFEYKLQNGSLVSPSQDVIATVYPQCNESDITKVLAQTISNILCDGSQDDWVDFYLRYDPALDLAKVSVPAFLIYGEKDTQVPASLNVPITTAILPSGKIKEYPSLNHLLQHAITGGIGEYQTIEETISPEVLTDIVEFINTGQ